MNILEKISFKLFYILKINLINKKTLLKIKINLKIFILKWKNHKRKKI